MEPSLSLLRPRSRVPPLPYPRPVPVCRPCPCSAAPALSLSVPVPPPIVLSRFACYYHIVPGVTPCPQLSEGGFHE
jgi:hypothetical protein